MNRSRSIFVLAFLYIAVMCGDNNYPETNNLSNQTEKVLALKPLVYTFSPYGVPHYGLDPQDVFAIYPELVVLDSQGNPSSVNYVALVPILINVIQNSLIQN